VDKGQGFVDLSGLVVGVVVAAIGLALVAVGRKRARVEHETDDRHFSEVALALAKKNNGQVQVDQVAKASGLSRDEATARMRQLTGRGLFDLDAESPHLHTVLAEVLVKQGRIADAEDELKTALALDSKYGPAHVLSGRIAVSRGQTMQARDHFQAAVEGQPDDPDAYRELARLLLSIGDVPAAQRVAERLGDRLQAAQKLSGDDADELVAADRLREQAAAVWVELGRFQAQHGDDAAAESAFAQARSASPSDPDALMAEAAWLEAKRKYGEARDRYLRLLAQ